MKFGGTSVQDQAQRDQAAGHILKQVRLGHQPVVVVSARAGDTDALISLATHEDPAWSAEHDLIVSTGEQTAAALVTLACRRVGLKARVFTAWQLPLVSDSQFGKARLEAVSTEPLHQALAEGFVPVVCGFQGITPQGQITTLGRGGSDLSAVSLAWAMEADCCMLYKDVQGLQTADPRLVEGTQIIPKISYENMLEMSALGSKIIQARAVKMAWQRHVPVTMAPFQYPRGGTHMGSLKPLQEKNEVIGLVSQANVTRVTLEGIATGGRALAPLFEALARANIGIDLLTYAPTSPQGGVVTFTIDTADRAACEDLLTQYPWDVPLPKVTFLERLSKISVIGTGLRENPFVAGVIYQSLSHLGILVDGLVASESRLSVLVSKLYMKDALRALHRALKLETDISETLNEDRTVAA